MSNYFYSREVLEMYNNYNNNYTKAFDSLKKNINIF